MKILWLIPYYISWHYTIGIKNLFNILKDFLKFVLGVYSLELLGKTLFAPFERIKAQYKGGLNIEKFFETLTANFISRVVGFIMRIFVIVVGLISLAVSFVLAISVFVVWIVLPFVLAFLFISSLISLFN